MTPSTKLCLYEDVSVDGNGLCFRKAIGGEGTFSAQRLIHAPLSCDSGIALMQRGARTKGGLHRIFKVTEKKTLPAPMQSSAESLAGLLTACTETAGLKRSHLNPMDLLLLKPNGFIVIHMASVWPERSGRLYRE